MRPSEAGGCSPTPGPHHRQIIPDLAKRHKSAVGIAHATADPKYQRGKRNGGDKQLTLPGPGPLPNPPELDVRAEDRLQGGHGAVPGPDDGRTEPVRGGNAQGAQTDAACPLRSSEIGISQGALRECSRRPPVQSHPPGNHSERHAARPGNQTRRRRRIIAQAPGGVPFEPLAESGESRVVIR